MKKLMLTAVAAVAIATTASAQIPNGDFEAWTSMGSYSNPDSWGCLNDMTSTLSVYTCTKGTPGVQGASYLKLVSKDVPGIGVVPGIAVSGTIDMESEEPGSGFAYTKRPTNFTGSWQYMAFGSDMGFVNVELTRWDAATQLRVSVATAYQQLTGMAMSWTAFTVPFTYTDEGNPDSCLITLSASGETPAANDYLYVDNLAFTGGNTTGLNEKNASATIRVFPNPVSDKLEIVTSEIKGNNVQVDIFDILGKKVLSVADYNQSNKMIDISHLSNGEYFVKLTSADQLMTTKFLKK